MSDTKPTPENFLETVLAILRSEAVPGAAIMRAIAFGDTGANLLALQSNAGSDVASLLALAREQLAAADKGPAPMETNVNMVERNILRAAHDYSLLKSGISRDSHGNMVHLSLPDSEQQAEFLATSIVSRAGELTSAAHVDSMGAK